MERMCLENLKLLDNGIPCARFNRQVSAAVDDCMDRAVDKKPRKVALVIELLPETDQRGDCVSVAMEIKIKTSVPDHRSRRFDCRPSRTRKGGQLAFNPESPDNADQETLDFDEQKGGDA